MIAECLIVAGALGAGIFIGADCVKLSARAKIEEARVDRDLAHQDAVEAQSAVGLVSMDLSEVRRELELAEELLALAHGDVDRAQAGMVLLAAENLRLRADPPWMQHPVQAFHRPLPAGSVVVPGPGCVA